MTTSAWKEYQRKETDGGDSRTPIADAREIARTSGEQVLTLQRRPRET
ncbi:MAG: hypothetical protein KJP26_05240 [Maribacter sp.]|nr:hypothetical protein [Maribacter sp.]